jgi:hypothetical protein
MTPPDALFKKEDKVVYTNAGAGYEVSGTVTKACGFFPEAECHVYQVVFDEARGYGLLIEGDLKHHQEPAAPEFSLC